MATAINQITGILAHLVDQQDRGPINQPVGREGGEDRALERFQRFSPPKFLAGPDPKAAEN